MLKKKNESDILVTILLSKEDGKIYDYVKGMPERLVRGWEIKKMAINQFEVMQSQMSQTETKRK